MLLQELNEEVIGDVLGSLHYATEAAPGWAKAWHNWALFNVQVSWLATFLSSIALFTLLQIHVCASLAITASVVRLLKHFCLFWSALPPPPNAPHAPFLREETSSQSASGGQHLSSLLLKLHLDLCLVSKSI